MVTSEQVAVIEAAQAVIDTIEWHEDGDMVVSLDNKRYGWDTNEPTHEPMIVALVALRNALVAYRAQEG